MDNLLVDLFWLLPIIFVLVCIVSEAFFAGSELAILSADQLTLEGQAAAGDAIAERVLWFKRNPDQLFGTTLIGTNISTVSGSTVASLSLLSIDPSHGEWWAMLIMSPLVLMGGEILPKSIAQYNAVQVAKRVATPLVFFNRMFTPAVWLIEKYTKALSNRFNLEKSSRKGISREELIYLVRSEENDFEDDERDLIAKIFEFSHLQAEDIMVPLAELEALSKGSTVEDGVHFIQNYGFSRIPIYEQRVDQIIGVVHHLDLLTAQSKDEPIDSLMRPVIYAPEMQDVHDLLLEVQSASASLVVVVDEFGGAVGIITLEDMIEEIVGEIDDEFDEDERLWTVSPQQVYSVQARVDIMMINERFLLGIPDSEDYDTLAGYILSQLRRIPSVGESVTSPSNVTLYVTKVSNRAIEEVSFKLPPRHPARNRRQTQDDHTGVEPVVRS